MNTLQEKLRKNLQAAVDGVAKKASESDDSIIAKADKTPEPTPVSEPAAGETGAVSDITIEPDETHGLATDGDKAPATTLGDSSNINRISEPTADSDAAGELDIQKGEVTKEEGIDMIKKAANAIRRIGADIRALTEEQLQSSFNKTASAGETPQELLYKCACAGDKTAQAMIDMMASYELGIAKKASDMAEAEQLAGKELTPEEAAALDAQLNEEALNNPEGLLTDEEATGEPTDEDVQAALQQAGAVIEEAAQEATIEVAAELMKQDPELSEEEALTLAQGEVADAMQTLDAQQLIGAMDEAGNYIVDDDTAAEAVGELAKSASAHPLRDALCQDLNAHFGLSPENFVRRLV